LFTTVGGRYINIKCGGRQNIFLAKGQKGEIERWRDLRGTLYQVRAHFNLAAGLHISYNIDGSLGSWPGRATEHTLWICYNAELTKSEYKQTHTPYVYKAVCVWRKSEAQGTKQLKS